MITVKFPALNKALTKDVKDLPDNDPRRGIIVLNNNAIVLQNTFCFVCNLREYFMMDAGIEDDYELEELDRILFFMDEKVFSNEFWSELTNGSNMKMKEGNLFIENLKYSKDLHHKEIPMNLIEPLKGLTKISKQPENVLSAVGIPFGALNKIYSVLPTDFKSDVIILEFGGQDLPVKFTFRKRKFFYGYIHPHYDAAQEGFRFESLDSFVDNIKDYLKNLEDNIVVVPPPPGPPDKVQEKIEEDRAQLKIIE